MNTLLVWANFTPLALIAGATTLFLRRALPLRRERPELLQNGLWFLLPFLLTPLTSIFFLVLLPISAFAALIAAFIPSAKVRNSILWAALGHWVATILLLAYLGVLNTYFVH